MFYAFLSGGGGCDYTMGCNLKLEKLKATTLEEANVEAAELFQANDHYGCNEILIMDVSEVHVFDPARARAKMELAEAQAEEDEKRAEYEKLRKRFEG